MRRNLQILGSPVLREKSRKLDPVKEIDFVDELLVDMRRTISEEDGLGLAAPQVGEGVRLFIISDEVVLHLAGHTVFMNPVIFPGSSSVKAEEGCLSIPGVFETVRRPSSVRITAHDSDGKVFTLELDGLAARVVQHEYDHLEGILFIDRLSPLKRRMLRNTLAGIMEDAAGKR